MQVFKFMQDLRVPSLDVTNCGCLGGCGSGPNVGVKDAHGNTRVINHVATPADALEVLDKVCGVHVAPHIVKATTLRLAANNLANEGNLPAAISKYSEVRKHLGYLSGLRVLLEWEVAMPACLLATP